MSGCACNQRIVQFLPSSMHLWHHTCTSINQDSTLTGVTTIGVGMCSNLAGQSFCSHIFWPFSLWSRYSRTTLITWTIDRIREPKAREPVWYLKHKLTVSVCFFPVKQVTHLLTFTNGEIQIQPLTEGLVPARQRWGRREYLQAFWRPSNMRQRPLTVWPGPGRSQSWHTRRRETHCKIETRWDICGRESPRHKRQTGTLHQDTEPKCWRCWMSAGGDKRQTKMSLNAESLWKGDAVQDFNTKQTFWLRHLKAYLGVTGLKWVLALRGVEHLVHLLVRCG